MKTNRLEAFSDGVLAIIITIMVLELKVPEESDFHSLIQKTPVFETTNPLLGGSVQRMT